MAVVRFGRSMDTQDSRRGRPLKTRPAVGSARKGCRRALRGFVGLMEQTPPCYSARKVDGKRLYELARAGRGGGARGAPVHIDEARLIFFRSPDAGIFVRCSKGTY